MSSNYVRGGFDWDDPAFQVSRFFKFTAPGDEISGTVREIKTHTFEARGKPEDHDYSPAKTVPVLVLDTAQGEQEVTCSQKDLLEQTITSRPQVGDSYRARFLRKNGQQYLFHVEVTRAVAEPAQQPAHTDLGPVRADDPRLGRGGSDRWAPKRDSEVPF